MAIVLSTFNKFRLNTYIKSMGEQTYDELATHILYLERILNVMDVLDPAAERFRDEFRSHCRYAELVNDSQDLGRKEHLKPIQCLVLIGTEYKEEVYWVLKPELGFHMRRIIMSAIVEKHKTHKNVDFVTL